MIGTRGGVGRIAAMVVGLVVCAFLLLAGTARGARYTVVQCRAGVGLDADWGDTTGGAKFRPDAYCDGGPGDHAKSFTRDGAATVSGEQFARWRWLAPGGTYLTKVTGDWWHALHDGLEQRIGSINWAGGFEPKLAANGTDTTQRYFELGFPVPVAGIEDRLLCARGGGQSCSLGETSWSGIKDLTFELEDEKAPGAGIGGELTAGGWHRGAQSVAVSGSDVGSGVRYGETLIDGARAALTEYPCAAGVVDGALVATRMGPCYPLVEQAETVDTTQFGDGDHSLVHCVYDFSGAQGCTAPRTLGIDNHAPGPPQAPAIADGGEGWHRTDRFAVGWADPDQGPASPIWGAYFRITGASGFDGGVNFVGGQNVTVLPALTVPGPGAWDLHLWLRDEAGNETAANGIDVPLRFDDQPPSVAFADGAPTGNQVTATVRDPLSGPARGTISYRCAESQSWTDLPSRLHDDGPGGATLSASLPDLPAGTWVFRAEAIDAAGNPAASSLHADGTQMSIQVLPTGAPGTEDGKNGKGGRDGKGGKDGGDGKGGRDGGDGKGGRDGRDGRGGKGGRGAKGRDGRGGGAGQGESPGGRARTVLAARLRGGDGHDKARGATLTVPFGASAHLSGRLTTARGAGLVGRRIKVVTQPSQGSPSPRTVERIATTARGHFTLRLGPGTSRRLSVSFPGDRSLAPAPERSLDLRVRAAVTLKASPVDLLTGESVRLSGRVRPAGATIPNRGKLVAIQYHERAADRWSPALVARTDADGHFQLHYRFRYVTGLARVRLRAAALPEAGWPYAQGASPSVTVTVDGR